MSRIKPQPPSSPLVAVEKVTLVWRPCFSAASQDISSNCRAKDLMCLAYSSIVMSLSLSTLDETGSVFERCLDEQAAPDYKEKH